MAELKFDHRELSDGEPLICVFVNYDNGMASHVMNLRGDKVRIVGMGTELTADELDQIAAKLRSLNGEPNTRSTDERVVALRERVAELLGRLFDQKYDFDEGVKSIREWVSEEAPELFPACKPSEEEVNG